MIKKLWSWETLALSFLAAFTFCFFIGIFWNSSSPIISRYDDSHHYYINRGYPVPWAGVSAASKQVEFPVIKMPFLTRRDYQPDSAMFTKIVDLRIFISLYLVTLFASYPFLFIFVRAGEENKGLNKLIVVPLFAILLLASIFAYFFWFPRI